MHNVLIDVHVLTITRNVGSILRHLRKPKKRKFLWIDTACIQEKDDEKGTQVRCMSEVYHETAKVHICVGAELLRRHKSHSLI